ncbi:Craniofacial development protein 2 like protein [Argiope bruennichi]|uniref:Craniofacial development protein 2 like protein n=1 Tax=Argiope bruennichi TaxID=94029 RepID=A0A8T0F425_ARGBR|nr:Craniofacial development protein 2 like protein [Argiope bruennichi]
MKRLGQGIIDKKDCRVYYSCQGKTHQFGIGFIVGKRLRNSVIDFQAINIRLCKIRLRGRHYNITLICAHSPTEEKDDPEKDLFYDLLMKSYNSCPAQDMKLILGDFNAKLGRERFLRSHSATESLHNETNENGLILFDFAVSINIYLAKLVSDLHEVLKVWRSYFQDLLEARDDTFDPPGSSDEPATLPYTDNPPPSLNEAILTIKKLTSNRAAGPDYIPSELLKDEEPGLINAIHKIMIKIWAKEKLPIE